MYNSVMKVVVARSDRPVHKMYAIEYDEAKFAFDPENYEMRRKYPPPGKNGDEFAEQYKQQTPEQRAEELATAMVTEEGKYNLESVVVTEINDVTDYTVKFWNQQTSKFVTTMVSDLYERVEGAKVCDVQEIVHKRFEMYGSRVVCVTVDDKVIYDNAETVKQGVLEDLGW